MDESILNSIKKLLGIPEEDPSFDLDIITAINNAFFTLNQLAVGPANGFHIVDNTAIWSQYFGTMVNMQGVITYVQLKARLVFDPPTTSFAITAIENQIKELEFRLNVEAERQLAQ